MKLVGRMLSPFVRRVAATLNLYDMEWESWPLSTVSDMAEILKVNPVGRVPVLYLDDGETLVDSSAILDHLDELAGERALTPRGGPERRAVLHATAIALGTAEKSVSAFYEAKRRPEAMRWPDGLAMLTAQARGGFAALDAMLEGREHLALGRLTQADVTAVIALEFAETVLPELAENRTSRLSALRDRLNADPRFAGTKFTG